MKIIICGLGNIGTRVAEQFAELGERLVLVSFDGGMAKEKFAKKLKCRLIQGDAREEAVLESAGVARCDALLALTGDDEINLEIALRARSVNPGVRTVVRLFDESFSLKVCAGFDIQKALSVSSLAYSSFVSSCAGEWTIHTFKFGGRLYQLARIEVTEESPLAGMTPAQMRAAMGILPIMKIVRGTPVRDMENALRAGESIIFLADGKGMARLVSAVNPPNLTAMVDSGKKSVMGLADRLRGIPTYVKIIAIAYAGILSLAVPIFSLGLDISLLDALYFTLTTTTTVGYGDISLLKASPLVKLFGCAVMLGGAAILASVFSIVTDTLISRRFGRILGVPGRRIRDHVIVAGLGNVGFRVASLMHEGGEKVVGIENVLTADRVNSLSRAIPVIIGSATHTDVLQRAGVERARAVMALTDNDMVNLNILIDAKQMNPGIRTVGRFYNAGISERAVRAFGIDSAMSASRIAAPTFAAAALHPDVIYAFTLHGTMYVILETCLGKDGHDTVHALTRAGFTALLTFTAEGPAFIDAQSRPEKGDRLLVLGHYDAVKGLAGIR